MGQASDEHCEEVIFSLCLFVCLFVSRITQKSAKPILTNFCGKVAHGPRKNPLDVGGNTRYVMVRVGAWLG